LVKLILGPHHRLEQVAALKRIVSLILRATGGSQTHAGPFGQHLERLAEFHPLGPHHEAEDIAAKVADPTLERLPVGIHLKAGPRVVVPRAKADVAPALPPQRDVAADQVDDVDRLPDLLFRILQTGKRHAG
jgi:hypothetical protein